MLCSYKKLTETIHAKRAELEQIAADTIEKAITALLEKKDLVVLGVPGGRSVPGIFSIFQQKNIPWNKVHIFMVDERLVLLDDPESNYKLAKESFLDKLVSSGKLPKENIHPFIFDETKKDAGTAEYKKILLAYGGKYDIVFLSSGEDGHIAALYPDHHSFEDESEFFAVMHDSPKPPKDRMTLSRKLLLRSSYAIILFFGESKRQAYNKFLDKEIQSKHCPAKLVLSIKESYVLTDIP